ncbi:MAG: DUF6266 family protein [Bacteroidota bacterium]
MGKMDGGAYGPVSGRVGNTISYMLNGKNVIRAVGKIKKQPSVKQLAVRQAMKVVISFLRPMLPVINLGFKYAITGSERNAHNEAVSHNKLNAVTGAYPNLSIDYNKVKVSSGRLERPVSPTVKRVAGGLEFTWDTPELDELMRRRDRTMLAAYFPETKKAAYMINGANRLDGKDFLELTNKMLDHDFEAYIAFLAADMSSVSDSVYCEKV